MASEEIVVRKADGEKDIQKTEFLALISHDLKTPISNIIGFSGVLSKETYGTLNAKQKEYLGIIQDCSVYLLDLINDLLDLSKVEDNAEILVYERVNVCELVESCFLMIKHRLDEKELYVNFNNIPQLSTIVADKKRLHQIILNLLCNAVKYTDFGAVLLTLKEIEGFYTFSIQDTGCGIPQEKQEYIFSPYHRIDSRVEGTGLGLVLVKKFTELHGGWIRLQSVEEVGTTITVAIPQHLKVT